MKTPHYNTMALPPELITLLLGKNEDWGRTYSFLEIGVCCWCVWELRFRTQFALLWSSWEHRLWWQMAWILSAASLLSGSSWETKFFTRFSHCKKWYFFLYLIGLLWEQNKINICKIVGTMPGTQQVLNKCYLLLSWLLYMALTGVLL